jgi:hypothetical protein
VRGFFREHPLVLAFVLSGAFGAAVVLMVFGVEPLIPRNQGWLWTGLGVDPPQLWLGWTFFRHSPWALPPAANPDYGLELGTSIYFSDTIPLLALVFKAVRGVVEVPQYVGLWLLACGLLQGVLGCKLIGLATPNTLARAFGGGLLALQPMLIHRMTGHTPLAGQWTILAALFLGLSNGQGRRHGGAWAGLLAVTCLVHSYLLAMIVPLWAADWLRRAWFGDQGRDLALEAAAIPGIVVALLWVGGFFLLSPGGYNTGPGQDFGQYGAWNFDLLAFFDGGQWSRVLPDLPDAGHWESGNSYLGLGGLLLLLVGALSYAMRPAALPRRCWPVLAALFLLFVFAVTHRVTIAGHTWTIFNPPDWLLGYATLLRNSERMVWPLAYAAMFGSIVTAARTFGGQRTGYLLLALLAVQWIDISPGLARRRSLTDGAPREAPQRLTDPFWAAAAKAYSRVRAVPAGNLGEGWDVIAPFAARVGLATDAVYLARVDGAAVAALRAKVAVFLAAGRYEPGTLYVLRDEASLQLARAGYDPRRDLLIRADGFWVLAPAWRTRPN